MVETFFGGSLEKALTASPKEALALFDDAGVWKLKIAQEQVLSRLMRRFAATGQRADLTICAKLLKQSPGPEQTKALGPLCYDPERRTMRPEVATMNVVATSMATHAALNALTMMPAEYERSVNLQEMADLITFLKAAR